MIAQDQLDDWLERWEDRIERGESPSVDEFLAAVDDPVDPELAQIFRQRVRALGWIQGQLLGESQAATTASNTADDTTSHVFAPGCGRYRAVRLHARGGLGEVFMAADSELDRMVALKLIQA